MTAMPSSRPDSGMTISRWLFRLLLWLSLPTLVVAVALGISLDSSRQAARNAVFNTMEQEFCTFQEEADPQIFFQREFEGVFNSVRGLAARPDAINAVVKGFSQNWPAGSIEIHVFSGSGELIPLPGSPPELQDFMNLVRKDWTHQLDLTASTARRLAILPSPKSLLLSMKGRPGKAVQLGGSRTFTWGFHDFQSGMSEQRIAGILIFIHQQELPKQFIPEHTRQRLGLARTVIAGDEAGDVTIPGLNERLSAQSLARQQAHAADDRMFMGDQLVLLKRFDDTTLVISSMPDPGFPPFLPSIAIALYIIAVIYIAINYYASAFRGKRLEVPVWGKLLLFFGLGFGFPLVLSGVLAHMFLDEKREGILEEQRQEAFRHLSTLDAGFAPYLTRQRLHYSRLCRDMERNLNFGLDLKSFDKEFDEYRFDGLRIVASSGVSLRTSRIVLAEMRRCLSLPKSQRISLYQNFIERGLIPSTIEVDAMENGKAVLDRESTEGSQLEAMIGRVAIQAGKLAMDQFNIDHGRSGARQSSKADLVVDSVLEDDAKDLIQGVRTGIQKFISLSSGESIAQMYLDVIAGPPGDAWYAIFIFHNLITLQINYLETVFNQGTPDGHRPEPGSPLRLMAVSWHHQGRNYPNQREYRTFSKLLARLNRSPNAVSLTMELDGAPHFVCALPGSALKHYMLLGIVPVAELERRFSEVSARVWGSVGILALLGLAVLIALWCSVVTPIAAVTEGLEAMKTGSYDKPIPVTGRDELGQMCSAINQAMGRLQEMEIARTVQADLLPQNRLDLGTFLVQGRNHMIQAVGGDYFDFIPLHSGLTAIILGDVSGHGVSAALVTAMAKAAFTILCPRYPDQPDEVLMRMNKLMLSILNRTKIMSCFLGILDTQSSRLMAANAGQCYPVLMSGDGTASQVKMPSQPLGTRSKAVFKRLDIDLRNAGLLLYSDGLVEAMSPEHAMFGYDNVTKAAAELHRDVGRRISSETDLLAPMFTRLQAHMGTGSYSDDVTLVIIMPRA